MSLKGVDVSDYDSGLNLNNIDYDFMICKISEGTSIVHSSHTKYIAQAKSAGKLWGFYHFFNKEDPVAQANFFYQKAKNFFGSGIAVLDYEDYGRIGTDKAKQFLDRIYELTGVRCMIYTSRSVTTEENWSAIAPNHKLWVAQYANMNTTGYQDSPWLPSGSFGAWSKPTIHQYTGTGRISGYSGDIDLNIGYLTSSEWKQIAASSKSATSTNSSNATTLELATKVMAGEYGTGDARKQALGSRYSEVQEFINHIFSATAATLAQEVKSGKYGNGDTRKTVLGDRYDEVQAIVNGKSSSSSTSSTTSTTTNTGGNMGLTQREAFAQLFEHLCSHDGSGGHGYSQTARDGSGSETVTLGGGVTVTIAGGDRDCSSAVISALKAVGVNTGSASYTGNMRSQLTKNGQFYVSTNISSAQRGDIYLNDTYHTAVCLGNGKLGQFSISEKGTVSGQQGDQTGSESNIRNFYTYSKGWNCVLRWANDGTTLTGSTSGSTSSSTTSSTSGTSSSGFGGTYTCTINGLNVRSSPSLSGSIVAQYNKNQTVVLDDWYTSADGWIWGRYTAYSGATRYIAVKSADGGTVYLSKGGSSSSGTSSSGSTSSSKNWAGSHRVTAPLNVRKGPGLNYSVTGTLPTGYNLYLDGTTQDADGYTWARYTANGGVYRWVATNWLS